MVRSQCQPLMVMRGGSSSTPSILPFLYAGTGVLAFRVHVTRLYHPNDAYYNVIYEIRACIFLCLYCDDLVSNY